MSFFFLSPAPGGDSHGVQLQDIQDIASTNDAFAATRVDGTVATWGDPRNGGNSSEVQDSSGLRYEWDVFFALELLVSHVTMLLFFSSK